MNKIIVRNNKIEDFISDNFIIKNNNIIINNDGNFIIEYIESYRINLNITISKNIFVNIFEFSENNELNINNKYKINENSTLTINKFYNNNGVVENTEVNLEAENSKFNYYFSSITNNDDDYHLIIRHNDKNTSSNIDNRILCLEQGNVNMIVDSYAPKGNVKSYLNQSTKIITLGHNHCLVKPNMFIEEEDIEACHSSVIGSFNEEEIFYLMSRGIEKEKCIKLLAKGFIFSNLKLSKCEEEKINNIINKYWR